MVLNEQQTKEQLRNERQVNVRIREDKQNANYKFERVFVNGVEYDVEVGRDVLVPETIYNMLVRKGVI